MTTESLHMSPCLAARYQANSRFAYAEPSCYDSLAYSACEHLSDLWNFRVGEFCKRLILTTKNRLWSCMRAMILPASISTFVNSIRGVIGICPEPEMPMALVRYAVQQINAVPIIAGARSVVASVKDGIAFRNWSGDKFPRNTMSTYVDGFVSPYAEQPVASIEAKGIPRPTGTRIFLNRNVGAKASYLFGVEGKLRVRHGLILRGDNPRAFTAPLGILVLALSILPSAVTI